MAKLPTEQDIGELPDRLPRRMGVGGWQPGDLARGAEEVARGGDQLGMSLGRMAGENIRLNNEADFAKAQSQAAVDQIKTAQAITNSNDPAQVGDLRQDYQTNVDNAAQLIRDPDTRAKFQIEQAPKVAQYQVGADDHAKGLVKDQTLANFDTDTTTSINAAVATDDEGQRSDILNAIKANANSLINRGIMTQEEWARKAPDVQHQYASARVDAEVARAKATGDTSRLQDLSKLFTFNPGEWSTAPPAATGAPGGAPASVMQQAILGQESRNNSKSPTSVDGAVGPGQILQSTFDQYAKPGERIDNPADNRAVNARILEDYAKRYNNDPARIAVAYFSGPHNVAPPDSKTPYLHDRRDGNGKYVSSYVNDVLARVASIQGAQSGAAPAAGGAPPARGVVAAGDSLGVGVAGAAGQDNTGKKFAEESIPPLPDPTKPNAPNVLDKIGALPDGAGKTLVLSTGASNASNLDPATYVPQQVAAAKAKGYDVVVLGVGTKFDALNGKLKQQALAAGAQFQPLDASKLSPDGVHPTADGYKAIVSQIGGGAAPAQPGAFVGLPPPGAVGANPHLAPPQEQWPADARGVEHNADGSLSYVMSEGNRVPVPGSRATGAPGAPSPSGTGTILDALKPHERAELGVRIQNEIDAIQRGKAAQDNQYAKAAVADLTSRVDSMTAGRPIDDNEMKSLQPYAQSANPDVRKAYAQFMAIHDNLAKYSGMSPAAVQADVEAKEAAYNALRSQYPNSPSIETAGLILNAAEKFAKTYQTEAYKQPIERAIKSGILPQGAAAISPNDPNVEDTLRRRVADAHTAADGLGVPIRYLQQSERPMLKEIARAGGEPMVDMAMHIVRAAGADAPAIFKEIGVDAPMFQKVGELAAGGGDPEAVRDLAMVINAKSDKAARGDVPTFSDKMLSKFEDPLQAAASRFGQDFAGRTRAAANMLMSAEASRQGYDPKGDPSGSNWSQQNFNRAYDLATGATFDKDGTKFGGIVDRRPEGFWQSAKPVMVPNNMKANDFSSVINSIQPQDLRDMPNPPMGKNGAPITAAQIQRGLLEALPDKDGIFRGKYAVFSDGYRDDDHLVRDAAGRPWALDLAQPKLDTALRARNPNSYATRAPAPQPERYRSTPGMVALTNEAETE